MKSQRDAARGCSPEPAEKRNANDADRNVGSSQYNTSGRAQDRALLSVFRKRGTLTKVIRLQDDALVKDSAGCAMARGEYRRETVDGLPGLDALLSHLSPQQAVAFGVADVETAPVVAKRDAAHHPSAITRTADRFNWPSCAVLMLDYDPLPGDDPLAPDDLRARVVRAVPELAGVSMLWRPSASSCIFHRDGRELVGIAGQRLYVLVDPGPSIPRIGEALVTRLWLAGYGRIEVSRGGALLERCSVDATVWQPERLDFAAGALCVPPLERRAEPGRIFEGAPVLRAAEVPALTPDERARYQALVQAARTAAKPSQQTTRELYVENRAPQLGGDLERARATIRLAVEAYILGGEFPLQLDSGERVTVAAVLAAKQRFHGQTLADPLEPEYGGGRGKAKLLLSGARPCVHSFAHGGRVFHLRVASVGIQAARGRLHEITERTIEALAAEPDLFAGTGGLVLADADTAGHSRQQLVNIETLTARAAGVCSYFAVDDKGNRVEMDPPARPLAIITKRRDRCGFRELLGVVTAPTLRADGSLLTVPGYDAATHLLLLADDALPYIPEDPTEAEREGALRYLWEPFSGFDFATELDRAVFLAMLLTATVRQSLSTAPGCIISASTAGTGKTKLAQSLAILAGDIGETRSWPADSNEQRKSITAALMAGRPALIWDNCMGHLQSDVLCATLTSPVHADRILNVSENARMSTRTMVIATGNNLEAAGDLSRRMLRVELDPGCAEPWRRSFAFDPVAVVRERRQELVAAALTLLRAYIAVARPAVVRAHTGSFEEWSRLARSTVIWLGFKDPEESLLLNLEGDPETQALRDVAAAWLTRFGVGRFVTMAEVGAIGNGFSGDALADALRDALPRGELSARSIGKWLGYRKGRIIDGVYFRSSRTMTARGWTLQQAKAGPALRAV